MPRCGSDPSHAMGEWWQKNELGRWYECRDCGATSLAPSLRFRAVIFSVRLRELLKRRYAPATGEEVRGGRIDG